MIKINLFPTPIALFKLDKLNQEEENFLLNIETKDKNNEYLSHIASDDNYVLDKPEVKNLKNNTTTHTDTQTPTRKRDAGRQPPL